MPAFRLAAAAVVSLVALGPATAQPPVQHIELRSYAYSPRPIHLKAGRPVTLHFMNRAGKGHDFTARRFFAAARVVSGQVVNGEIDLGPGQATTVTLIPAAGRYKVHCGHPFHKVLGMKAEILVD